MPSRVLGRATWCLLAAVLWLGCGGCSPAYVVRAAYEEGKILWRREPIERVLARGELGESERDRLALVLDVRRFAAERLGLSVGDAYAELSTVDEGSRIWVVSAAEKTRLRAYRWWFPIVGEVEYKGFFSKPDAQAEVERLAELGYDTFLRSTIAFSTLGWFDDPVLSTWLRYERTAIAETLIHELLHRTVYRRGDTTFNESMANFVGRRGAIAYFTDRGGDGAREADHALAGWRQEKAISAILGDALARLELLYAEPQPEGARERILAEREQVFAALRQQLDRELGGEKAPSRLVVLNNAVLLAQRAYLRELERFDLLWEREERDLTRTIARLRELAQGVADPFAGLPEAR